MWQYHTIMPQSKEVDNQKVEKICGNMANNCVMYVKTRPLPLKTLAQGSEKPS